MDPQVKEALSVLGFVNLVKLPKLKDIRIKFLKLSLLHHRDCNNGSSESTSMFQEILNAYETVGSVLKDTVYDDDDLEDEIDRKMFKQFSLSAIKENISSFTIITEKALHSIWSEILSTSHRT